MSSKTSENSVEIGERIYNITSLIVMYPLLRKNARKTLSKIIEYAKNIEEDILLSKDKTCEISFDAEFLTPNAKNELLRLHQITITYNDKDVFGIIPLVTILSFNKTTNSLTVEISTKALSLLKHLPDNCLTKTI